MALRPFWRPLGASSRCVSTRRGAPSRVQRQRVSEPRNRARDALNSVFKVLSTQLGTFLGLFVVFFVVFDHVF